MMETIPPTQKVLNTGRAVRSGRGVYMAMVGFSAFLLWAGVWTVRSAASSYFRERNEFQLATQMRPDLSQNWRDWADAASFDSPAKAMQYARKATALNGESWQNWTSLAMIQFQLNQPTEAEASLRRAVLLNSGFASHYQLASLALLFNDERTFARQIKLALLSSPADRISQVIQLAMHGSPDELGRLLRDIPDDHAPTRSAAAIYLVGHGHLAQAATTFLNGSCPEWGIEQCRDAAVQLVDPLANAALVPNDSRSKEWAKDAVAIWDRAVGNMGLPAAHVAVNEVPDGNFQHVWNLGAFSWRSLRPEFVTLTSDVAPNGGGVVQIQLSGNEPDDGGLFRILVQAHPGSHLILSFWSRTTGAYRGAGLGLQIPGLEMPESILPASLNSDWKRNTAMVVIPSNAPLLWLTCVYRRPAGSVRFSGTVEIANVRLVPVAEEGQSQ